MASEKITAIVESVKALTLLELNELVKAVEEEFGDFPVSLANGLPIDTAKIIPVITASPGA